MCRETCCVTCHQANKPRTKLRLQFKYDDFELCNVDYVSSNVKSSQSGAMLYTFEANEAVIKMIIKGRCPTMRHVSRSHTVLRLIGYLIRINLDSKNTNQIC